jgi:hypothetical protein
VRIVGSLTARAVPIVREVVDEGVAVLDLTEVIEIDDAGVGLLARLRAERCTLLACPRWLERWLASSRAAAATRAARRSPERTRANRGRITKDRRSWRRPR